MSDADTLNVWHEQHLAGQLWRNQFGAMGFRYDPQWLADGVEFRGRHIQSRGSWYGVPKSENNPSCT
jgi:hypothetical protein